ncbi:MAG: hypothetical protein V4685_13425 [Bacteroidota bacterium]
MINKLRLKLIDKIGGLNIYDTLEEYKKDQYLPSNQLDIKRRKKLDELFEFAKQSTSYYDGFSCYEEVPELNKKMVTHDPAAFISSLYKNKRVKKSTSGSTGNPFSYYTSVNGQSNLWAGLLLSWESAGYQFGEKVAFIAGNALIKKSIQHKIFYRLMNIDLYPVAVLNNTIIKDYIEKIRNRNTAVLYGYATAVNAIADHIRENNVTPPSSLKAIVCTSEMLTDSLRNNIEKAFGVKVFNQYGCNEAGVSAFECEQHNLHIISSRSVFETGKNGNFISTDLANEAQILMKYDTGDLVELSDETCACGRSYPVIKKIIGRTADVIVDRAHKKVHTTFFTHLLQRNSSIKQFQVVYDKISINLNLAVDQNFTKADHTKYINAMKNYLDFENYEITINNVFHTSKNLKHSFVVDQRNSFENVQQPAKKILDING